MENIGVEFKQSLIINCETLQDKLLIITEFVSENLMLKILKESRYIEEKSGFCYINLKTLGWKI